MKLRFVSPKIQGRFIRPSLPFRQVMQTFLDRFNQNLSARVLHQSHIGESVSLLYSPFYADHKIIDAVLNQPVSAELDASSELNRLTGGPADWQIRFVPTLCPHCGWDMQGQRDALVLHCKNCASMWQTAKNGWSRINVAHMPDNGNTEIRYLPFWRIRANVSGITLNSYADMVAVANLPKVVQPAWHRTPCHFWSPAFKVRPQRFMRLAQQVTLCQPRIQLVGEIPKNHMHAVNLALSESIETLKMNLAGLIRPKKTVEARIGEIHVKPMRYLLVYLPFEVRHHDLVQPAFNIAVNRNQLALAGNL